MPRVELISNVFHYYYTALLLHRSGYLQRYITGPCARDNEDWIRRYGKVFERLWMERRLEGIPPQAIKRLWLHELVQKGVTRLTGSTEYSNRVCNELFAHKAAHVMRECDAVHFVHGIGWVAARKAKRLGSLVICDMREEHPHFQRDILSEEAQHLGIQFTVPGSSFSHHVLEEIDLADYIFCPSSYAKRTFVERGISETKIVVCPYGVDRAKFTSLERTPRKEFRVLFLGRVCMRKGIQYLLEGFRKAELSDARLVLVGPVDPDFRVVLDRYRGLFEEVGSVSRSEVQAQYLAADVFVMPSLADSYGLVVSEAMSSALPVIVSENTGMADFIKNGREGFVVPIRDSDVIAKHLTFLHENRDVCTAMGQNGTMTVRALDWNNYQSVGASFYKSLFTSGAAAPAAAASLPQPSAASAAKMVALETPRDRNDAGLSRE
jgi:glycosyltransferase involved in cell wall biosynthesis